MTPTTNGAAARTSGVWYVNKHQSSVVQPAWCRDHTLIAVVYLLTARCTNRLAFLNYVHFFFLLASKPRQLSTIQLRYVCAADYSQLRCCCINHSKTRHVASCFVLWFRIVVVSYFWVNGYTVCMIDKPPWCCSDIQATAVPDFCTINLFDKAAKVVPRV